ncbi:extensin [Plutella xylostella]|uniref:extensin n=1 Tax=Plutella xylostella TaxID=51655 RepID=UPI0020327357|nr:extensin [Plutella xylostella]
MTALIPVLALLALSAASGAPAPGRVPKVYNALITSNQNLEPSKAYPVYQPVLQDPYFQYQPVFYSSPQFPQLFPSLKTAQQPPAPAASDNVPHTNPAPSEAPPAPEQPQPPRNEENKPTPGPPQPPHTESPIPLNQFGLPPQVLPLGRGDPAYDGFHQVAPFSYSYPGLRFYDPYDPLFYNPYLNLPPLYRPHPNSLGPGISFIPREASPAPQGPAQAPAPAAPAPAPSEQPPSSPPSEPDNLSVLNYSSKDPAIPNVPPPPLPQGGSEADSE